MSNAFYRGLCLALGLLGLSACTQAPDLRAVTAERAKPVQRYDNFHAAASNGKQLVSAGGGGVLVTSADGGENWTREVLPTPSSIVAMSACPDGSFAALDFYRKVWIGDTAGRNWQGRKIDADFNPVSLTCDVLNRLWVVGSYSTVLSSADKGQSWNAQPPGEDAILTTVQFLDAEHGFIAGEFGTLLVTRDGGATWTQQAGLPGEFYPYALVFTDAQTGWVSGIGGAILHTADGGNSWTEQGNAGAATVYALVHVGAQLFGVGGGGQVLRLVAGQWTPVANTPRFPSYLAAGAPLEQQGLLVAGAAGALKVVALPAQVAALASPIHGEETQP